MSMFSAIETFRFLSLPSLSAVDLIGFFSPLDTIVIMPLLRNSVCNISIFRI